MDDDSDDDGSQMAMIRGGDGRTYRIPIHTLMNLMRQGEGEESDGDSQPTPQADAEPDEEVEEGEEDLYDDWEEGEEESNETS